MAVTWLTPTDVNVTTAGSYVDVDVSASVPSGATGVILHVVNTDASFSWGIRLRKNGSTDDRSPNMLPGHFWVAVGLDGSRIFEAYIGDASKIDIYLVGYFTDDAVFFTNAVDKSLGATAAYTDVDISSDTSTDTAIAAILEVVNTTNTTSYNLALRRNGSTDDRYLAVDRHDPWGAIVPVDGAEIFEGKIANTALDFFLVGYITKNASFYTNARDFSLGSTGSYTDLSALPARATGALFEVHGSFGTSAYALRENGSSEDLYLDHASNKAWAVVKCDASQLIEGKIESTGTDFWLQGFFHSYTWLGTPTNSDNFNRADSDTVGTGWAETVPSGSVDHDIVGNKLYSTSVGVVEYTHSLTSDDFAFEVQWDNANGNPQWIQITGRWGGANYNNAEPEGGYTFYFQISGTNDYFRLYRRSGASTTDLVTQGSAFQQNVGDLSAAMHTFRVEFVGPTMTVKVDGVVWMVAHDTTHTSRGTKVAIRMPTNSYADNFALYQLDEGGGGPAPRRAFLVS